MIKTLEIKDYALIEHINVEFEKGFNIITGETGAGKSILIDAMGLLSIPNVRNVSGADGSVLLRRARE